MLLRVITINVVVQQTIFGCDCPLVSYQYSIWGEQIFVHVTGKAFQQYSFITKK